MTMASSSTSLKFFLLVFVTLTDLSVAQKIAVIGGGISGTFTSKYLVDFDREKCRLDSITIFDPHPIGQATPLQEQPNEEWQGSRVAALELEDGKVVELGASVFHEENHLIKEICDLRAENSRLRG